MFDEGYKRVPRFFAIPSGFQKVIQFNGEEYYFYFPNEDVAGRDWVEFKIR